EKDGRGRQSPGRPSPRGPTGNGPRSLDDCVGGAEPGTSSLQSWCQEFMIHWQCRPVRIALSAACVAILVSLVAATASEAEARDASGLDAPASDGSLETRRGDVITAVQHGRVADGGASIQAVSLESAPGQLVGAGGIAGGVVSCCGPVAGPGVEM